MLKEHLKSVHQTLDDASVGMFYAVYFDVKFYIGKVRRLISNQDIDSTNDKMFDMTFLYEDRGKSTAGLQYYTWPLNPDESPIKEKSIIFGPLDPTLEPQVVKSSTRGFDGKEKFTFAKETEIANVYAACKKNLHLLS